MAAAAGGIPTPALGANLITERAASELQWNKAPCRFCGTGCGVMVATKDNRVVATHGDIKAEVNKGLNCVKGYFLSKIMYGHDRLTRPMLRKTERRLRQERRVHAGVVGRGLRRDGREVQGRAEEAGTERRRHVRLRPVDHLGRLRGEQAVQGRLPLQQHRSERAPLHGIGRGRLRAHLRHRRADGLLRRHRGGGRVRAVGLEHGRDAPDPVDAGDRPAALRAACARRGALHLRAPLLRSRRHRRSPSRRIPISRS